MMNKVLVVVDMQKDFTTGPLGTPEAVAIIPKIREKIERYIKDTSSNGVCYGQIFFTQDTHRDNYLDTEEGRNLPVSHCILGTEGIKIEEELYDPEFKRKAQVTILPKERFAFEHWNTIAHPHFVQEVELVGVCTDICIISNALAIKLNCPGVRVTVDASCCAGTTPKMHRAALDVMKSCQIHVINDEE